MFHVKQFIHSAKIKSESRKVLRREETHALKKGHEGYMRGEIG